MSDLIHPMDIMMRIKGAGFSAIANAFREREKRLGGGLPLLDFVEIVLPGLPRQKTEEEKIASVSALVDLFEDIDINGDGVMEFDEFTSFCVDAGMVATRPQIATLKHRYERDTKRGLKTTAATISNPKTTSSHVPSSVSSILNPLSTRIDKLKWSAAFRLFLVLENAARSVKIFTMEGKLIAEVKIASDKQCTTSGTSGLATGNSVKMPINDVLLVGEGVAFVTPTSTAPPSASSVSILDAVFIHRFMWLGVSTTDFAISFYDMSDVRKPTSTWNPFSNTTFDLLANLGLTTTTAQIMLRFCESSALLLGSGNDFMVNVWKIVDAETKLVWQRLAGHSDLVLDTLEIPIHDLLVTCDLRHRIQLWDLTDGRPRGALVAHERGVRQLCYSEQHDLLLSAGFEFEALAWDVSSRQVALKLSGHRAPLVGVQLALFQTERAITADCQGVFKVWDITRNHASSTASSTCQAVQLESVDLGLPSVHIEPISFISLHPSSRDLWIATSGSCTLQRLRSVRVQQFDEVPLRAFYHYAANKFVVVAGSVCSLWDGETGACSEEFTHVGTLVTPVGATDAAATKHSAYNSALPIEGAPSTRNEPGTELLTCAHDVKCRKLVVVSEQGALGVFNCQNLVHMRQCHDSFLSKTCVQRQKPTDKTPVTSSAPSCAVVGLHYCSENKLIVVVDAGNNGIAVLDDNSDQESSKGIGILRRLVNIPGGISSSAYSFHASMVATVAEDPDGMKISLWDFETLALLGNCRYNEQDGDISTKTDGPVVSIHVIEFWDEFPVLIAGDSQGGVYFFAVTPLLHANTGKLLHAFINDHSPKVGVGRRGTGSKSSRIIRENLTENDTEAQDDSEDGKLDETQIAKEMAEVAARKLLYKSKNLRKNALTAVPVLKSEPETALEFTSAVTCMKVVQDEVNDRYLVFLGDERGCVGIWDPTVMMRRLALAKIPEIKCKYLRRGYQPKAMFYRDFLKDTSEIERQNLPPQHDKHRHAVSHGVSSDWRGEMLLGHDMEHMNVRASHMDVKRLSSRRRPVETRASRPTSGGNNAVKLPAQQPAKNPSSSRAKDTAVVNAVAAAEFLLKKGSTFALSKHRSLSSPQTDDSTPSWPGNWCYENFPRDVTLVRRWQAHVDAVTSLEISRHPNIVVTCGLDMRVFVWDWDGACLGKLFDPENHGPWPWRFRKDNATRTKEREQLVRELLQELERTPAEKMELRRQTLYAEHVGRRNVTELRNVNAMLLEHLISKNPEIKLLEQEMQMTKTRAEAVTITTKTSRFRDARVKTDGTSRALVNLPSNNALPVVNTPRQALRLQSLSQLAPLLEEKVPGRKVSTITNAPPVFLEPGDLKMDKNYLENELSITCPTASSSSLRLNRDGDVHEQIQLEYSLAQQATATRATLTRKAREMYSNLEGVRARHNKRLSDRIDQERDPLETSDFLKQHFASSTLAGRPHTAPVRALKHSSSVSLVPQRQKEPSLQISASESTLESNESVLANAAPVRRLSTSSSINVGASRRKSSLDELYVDEFHRHRQHKDPVLNEDLMDTVDGDKLHRKPLYKLHGINDIIEKAHGYCVVEDQSSSRPTTTETQTLRQHLENTKLRMQNALQDDQRVPTRQNLRRLRQEALERQQKRRMHSYLEQKRREMTTNIGNVFKGLQTSHEIQETAETGEIRATKTLQHPHMKSTCLKTLSTKKTFGMYNVDEVMSVIRLFWAMDTDGSGNISMTELQQYKSVFEKLGYPNLSAIFQTIDTDGDGQVSLRELLATCFHYATKQQLDGMLQLAKVGNVREFLNGRHGADTMSDKDGKSWPSRANVGARTGATVETEHKRELMAIFRVFDHNGDGGVSMQEIMEALRVDDDDVMAAVMTKEHDKAGQRHASYTMEPVLSSGLTREDVELIYHEFDRDKDATLDLDEFVAVMASLDTHKRNLLR